MPEVTFLDKNRQPVTADSEDLVYSRYLIRVNSQAHYQPHPAFAKDEKGNPLYLFDSEQLSEDFNTIADFKVTGSRPVHANDFIYQIKRLADPKLKSPMLGVMAQYIVGLSDLSKTLADVPRDNWVDLNDYSMEGLELIDERTFAITIYNRYPQFSYWLTMHFFAPIPPEADRFYHNPGFKQKNLTLDWYPIGSGAYMMTQNNPNSEIVLERNPNFRPDFFPSEGEPGDREKGFLNDAGKRLPFVDKAVFRLEKEVLPRWGKFLQGYYDRSGEHQSNTKNFFDQAFVVGDDGLELTPDLRSHELTLSRSVKPRVQYIAFNMRDPVVGGYSEKARKLRRALSIAYVEENYISIFHKGNALAAQGPIPPGITGYFEGEKGINPYVFDWVGGEAKRKSLGAARKLLAEAGYPNGRDANTGKPLKLYFDVQSQVAKTNSVLNWQRRQFESLGIQVEFRSTDWNRHREKLLSGNAQIFSHGWLADYPDPENFFILFYGPQSPLVCKCEGTNDPNYENAEFDRLFRRMREMPEGAERNTIVAKMVEMIRRDNVWLSAYHVFEYYLNNPWVYNTKRHGIAQNNLKYVRIEPKQRNEKIKQWNQPVIWPLVVGGVLVAAVFVPVFNAYRRRQKMKINH
jgi:peptide/nickel transport system substrate-binding protein